MHFVSYTLVSDNPLLGTARVYHTRYTRLAGPQKGLFWLIGTEAYPYALFVVIEADVRQSTTHFNSFQIVLDHLHENSIEMHFWLAVGRMGTPYAF